MTIHSFHARQDHHRSATTWQMLLDAASTEHEVVRTARDFMASFTPHEIELLPEECRPHKIVDGEDIAQFSYDLTIRSCNDSDAGAVVIQAFARFFADAAQRIARLKRLNESGERESA